MIESFLLWHMSHQSIFQSRVISHLGSHENVLLALVNHVYVYIHTHTDIDFNSLTWSVSTFSHRNYFHLKKIKTIWASFSVQGVCGNFQRGHMKTQRTKFLSRGLINNIRVGDEVISQIHMVPSPGQRWWTPSRKVSTEYSGLSKDCSLLFEGVTRKFHGEGRMWKRSWERSKGLETEV